ncbi:ATP dependent RNA helicase (Rok1), putative [Talaromyces stipitatus ATCC 10500]|uniref:ATP-dependent RNA helicase n=1 Tax=Talaromyces stipitatus (strain ATCC 10500 / CBS 375.48 / QM 6759 / NRRL 1006) TaxID=441959 RepID=B8M0N4_TALSN|nr:ATP dependent RNA helicase (Rok1), putative [Talaromyces stipitatus ATCC 10500]EED21417.1 ATP dependent RNA helicase (Rok1), putative [Talaromyces stipitatus ATCC 10500]
MDAFKLLTRSTKLKPSTSTTSSPLPSAGKAANPQLFGTADVQSNRKRKRQNEVATKQAAEERNDEFEATQRLLFGGSHSTSGTATAPAGKESKKSKNSKKDAPAKTDDTQEGSDSEHEVQGVTMDESERRSILKTHKIKVVDLRDLEEILAEKTDDHDEDAKTKKQKKRKISKEIASLSKKKQKEARQVYPEPLTTFQDLRKKYQISRKLAENIAEQGFTVPTEVQMGSLPLLLGNTSFSKTPMRDGHEPDLLAVAPTGSGKTLAFLIPLINKTVKYHRENFGQREITSIVVAPTKELVGQIVNEGRKLAIGTGVKITAMRKGMQVVAHAEKDEEEEDSSDSGSEFESDQEEDGDKSAKPNGSKKSGNLTKSDILVTTPLALVNALTVKDTEETESLPSVRHLVLDEADVLLDPLFREQTLAIWTSCNNPDLGISFYSATMGSSIEELTKSILESRHESLNAKKRPLLRLVIGLKDTAVPNIQHKLIYAATEQGKLLGLRQLLHPTAAIAPNEVRLRPPFLVFTQTITRAVALHSELLYDIPIEAGGSSRIAVLHSDLSETRRSEIMKDFRKGEIWIIITTDLLARGVDFRGINGVVNYDIPTSSAGYVHRVGRTGRAGREGGVAVTYYTKEDIPYVKSIANLIHASEKLQGKEQTVQKWLLDSLPDLSKKDRQDLKRHGVKARAASAKFKHDIKQTGQARISTKSGYDRRMENKRKGAISASRNRIQQSSSAKATVDSGDEWNGLDD